MIKIPLSDIIAKIKEQTSLSEQEINSKNKQKMDTLAGLISKEGAAHIVANELSVKLFDATDSKIKIKQIFSGMRSVETVGKVTNVFEKRQFEKKDGTTGKVWSFVLADETASIRVVLWNEQADKYLIKQGEIIKVKDAFVKDNQNGVELHLGNRGELVINPSGEKVADVQAVPQRQKSERKKIEDLKETDMNVELLGTIVQVFDPRFYETCPECGKRAKQKDGSFACDTHGEISPSYGFVMNAVIDDGTGTLRTVFFRNQAANLLKMDVQEFLKFKDSPGNFQQNKDDLLGKIIKIVGRVSKNEMFQRLEFVAQLVFPDPDPDEELKKLKEEAKSIE